MRKLFLLVVLACVAAAGYVWWVPAGSNRETFTEIYPGSSTAKIAAALKQQGVIQSKWAFVLYHLAQGGTLKAGEYRFDHPARMIEVYDRMHRGDVYTIGLTIPEGANLFDIAQKVEEANLGSKEAFLQAARQNLVLIADLDPDAESLEGYLFPDTYHFQRKATPAEMLAAMVKRFRHVAAQIGLAQNYRQIVTLASLIEKETPINEERPLVASVFENRLAKDMPLMTDPSVIYAALLDGRYRGTIYQSDLQTDSTYNTYKHTGLPPGPISNPGVASLKAALHPAQTDFLYFVAASANPSGRSKFSTTLEEHQQNVQAYRRAMRAVTK